MEQETDLDLSQWKGEHWSIVSPSWSGLNAIKYLIVFGASYCQTSIGPQLAPTTEEPLGVPFPGFTYTEGPPNWVGHLAKSRQPPFLVHNYARGGQTVAGVRTQVTLEFIERHPPAMPWTGCDTIFATWVGINDLGQQGTNIQPSIDALFEAQRELYEKGARMFLFVDVYPPGPAYKNMGPEFHTRFCEWNLALGKAIRSFVTEKATTDDPITAVYFSSHKVLSAIVNDPKSFGFSQTDGKRAGGSMWDDAIHPTSAVHFIITKELIELLSGLPPCIPQSEDN